MTTVESGITRTASMISHLVRGLILVASGHVIFVINYYLLFFLNMQVKPVCSIVCNLKMANKINCMGVPVFMEGSPLSYENGDPKIL